MYRGNQKVTHAHAITFNVEKGTAIEEYLARVPGRAMQNLHVTALYVEEEHKGIVKSAFQETPAEPFSVILGNAAIYRNKTLVINLLDPAPVHDFQQRFLEQLYASAERMMSKSYAKSMMDRVRKNKSLTTHPHISLANIMEMDIPHIPPSELQGQQVSIESMVLDIDYDKAQRMERRLTTSRA